MGRPARNIEGLADQATVALWASLFACAVSLTAIVLWFTSDHGPSKGEIDRLANSNWAVSQSIDRLTKQVEDRYARNPLSKAP